jgi:hypothetical protein
MTDDHDPYLVLCGQMDADLEHALSLTRRVRDNANMLAQVVSSFDRTLPYLDAAIAVLDGALERFGDDKTENDDDDEDEDDIMQACLQPNAGPLPVETPPRRFLWTSPGRGD